MLEFVEEKNDCQVKVGSFTYLDKTQKLVTADFFINTCIDDQSKRVSDYNEQLTDEWDRLFNEGFTQIAYNEISPSPIF